MDIAIMLVFSIFCFLEYRRNKISLGFILWMIYLGSFISTVVMNTFFDSDNTISFVPTIYLCFILFIFITPFNDVKMFPVGEKNLADMKAAIFFGFFSLVTVCYYAYYAYTIFTNYSKDLILFRSEIDDSTLIPPTLLSSFLSGFSFLYFIPLYYFFISVIQKWGRFFSIFLFTSSFSFILYTACYMGRDALIFWLFNAITLYLLFFRQLSEKIKKILTTGIIIFVTIMLGFLLFISITRFNTEKGEIYNLMDGTLGYYGQQLGNFNDTFYFDAKNNGTVFPTFSRIMKLITFDETTYNFSDEFAKVGLGHHTQGVFATFVQTLIFSYGHYLTPLLALLFFVIINNLKFRYTSFSDNKNYRFLLIFIVFQYIMNGVFYLRQALGTGDIFYFFAIVFLCYNYRVKKITVNF